MSKKAKSTKSKGKAKRAKNADRRPPLSMEKVKHQIEQLPDEYRKKAKTAFEKYAHLPASKRRHSSDLAFRQAVKAGKPEKAVPLAECQEMTRQQAAGASYRAIEVIHGLKPENGMDAYRAVSRAILSDSSGKFAKEIVAICKKAKTKAPKACKIAIALARRQHAKAS